MEYYTKDEVEDLTGVSHFSQRVVNVGNKIDLKVGPIIQIAEQASKLVMDVKTNHEKRWQQYVRFSLIQRLTNFIGIATTSMRVYGVILSQWECRR